MLQSGTTAGPEGRISADGAVDEDGQSVVSHAERVGQLTPAPAGHHPLEDGPAEHSAGVVKDGAGALADRVGHGAR
jgi:hypothetical protein